MKLLKTLDKKKEGMTFVEIMVVVGIISILASISFSSSIYTYRSYQYRATRQMIFAVFAGVRDNALNNLYQVPHGVRVERDRVVSFVGSSYVATSTYNVAYDFDGGIHVANMSVPYDVVFNNVSAESNGLSFDLRNGYDKSGTITITSQGAISW